MWRSDVRGAGANSNQQTKPAEGSRATPPARPIAGQGNDTAKISVPQTLEMALTHYQAGRLEQAEQLYRQILEVDPNQVDALHLLGVIAGRTGRENLAI